MRTTDPNHHSNLARHRRAVRLSLVACVAAVAAACSGGNEVADITTVAAPPTIGSTGPVESAVDTTVVETVETSSPDTTGPASTVADTIDDTVVDTGLTGPMFSDALGVQVASAPGVHTQGDTRQLLPAGLYVHIAWEPDPNDPSVFTVQPDDVEILEAYANASTAYYRAVTTDLTTDSPEFARFMVDAGAQYESNFDKAREGGYEGSLGNGVVLRPYVLGDQRTDTTATVLDCYLQNEQFILKGAQPTLSPLETKGTIATMVRTDVGWKVDVIASESRACL